MKVVANSARYFVAAGREVDAGDEFEVSDTDGASLLEQGHVSKPKKSRETVPESAPTGE